MYNFECSEVYKSKQRSVDRSHQENLSVWNYSSNENTMQGQHHKGDRGGHCCLAHFLPKKIVVS